MDPEDRFITNRFGDPGEDYVVEVEARNLRSAKDLVDAETELHGEVGRVGGETLHDLAHK